MCYLRRQECGWNTTHTSGFHDAWKRDPGTFALKYEHEYWEISWKSAGVTTGTRAYEGGGASTKDQRCSAIYEVISRHQGDASDARFSSFLTDFSKVLESLK